jgi:DNA processing protein
MRVLTTASDEFPSALRGAAGMPPALHVRGELRAEDALAVAIVGTRQATPYGLEMAERLAADLARRGVTIVSGLARGIDTAAHRGALRAGGRTMAVLGCGADVVYPPENARLMGEIAERGAVVTEFAPGTPPRPQHFPLRNRVIAGLALGVVVVEAAARSGSSITAGWAADLGREVMAVPGRVTSEMSRGCHALIKDGATLVETWEDVAGQLPSPWRDRVLAVAPAGRGGTGGAPAPDVVEVAACAGQSFDNGARARAVGGTGDEDDADIERLLRAIGDDPVSIEDLIEGSGVGSGRAAALLLTLELEGRVRQLAGKRFVRFPDT